MKRFTTLIFCVAVLSSFAQRYEFPCDSNYTPYGAAPVYEPLVAMRDTVNKANVASAGLEIRFWTFVASQIGPVHKLVVLRKEKRHWRVFQYSNVRDLRCIKDLNVIFSENEIVYYDKKAFQKELDVLLDNDVLTIESPTYATFDHITDMRMMMVSHDSRYTVEVVREGCARQYSVRGSWLNVRSIEGEEGIKQLNAIKDAFERIKGL